MRTARTETRYLIVAALVLLSLVVIAGCPFLGMTAISPLDLVGRGLSVDDREIFWRLRVPRVALGYLAGAMLALAGMTFQSMFRNPLATPYTLGVASGAAFGAAVSLKLGLRFSIGGISSTSLIAFAGALTSILLVYGVTKLKKGFSSSTMLLAGVAIGFLFSSIILFLQYVSDLAETFRIVRWLMGRLEVVGFGPVLNLVPFAAVGTFLLYLLLNELNLLSMGEEIAASRGVEVKRTKALLFVAASLMVGSVVAMCGPIGFVGMMAPHICRLLVGPDHRILAPATLLFGGLFLTLCDTLARIIIAPAEMPVGVITALLGAPFFLWLLLGSTR